MTPSYLTLTWSSPKGRDRAQQMAALHTGQCHPVHNGENLVVLASAGLPTAAASDNSLLLLGRVHGQLPDVTEASPADVLRHLTGQVWGSYLALLRSPDACFAMVDPSGGGRARAGDRRSLGRRWAAECAVRSLCAVCAGSPR